MATMAKKKTLFATIVGCAERFEAHLLISQFFLTLAYSYALSLAHARGVVLEFMTTHAQFCTSGRNTKIAMLISHVTFTTVTRFSLRTGRV